MIREDLLDLLPADSQRILFAPLNWGLGHATRSIPIIYKLLDCGKNIVLASDGEALELLKEEFPYLPAIELSPYSVSYNSRNLLSVVFSNFFNVLSAIFREKREATKLVKKHNIDTIISDSRFGFRSHKAHSVVISHQLNLKVWGGKLSYFVHLINQFLINRFNQCWIPDDPEVKLSGGLSINKSIKNKNYIGVQSRLKADTKELKYDIAILISGPEKARTIFEEKLIFQFKTSKKRIALIRGTCKGPQLGLPENWKVIERANSQEMASVINSSQLIISRAGYSSIMDYYFLGKKAIIIPTPGQAEQEYLARELNDKFGFKSITEDNLERVVL